MAGPTSFGYQNLGFGAGISASAGALTLIKANTFSSDSSVVVNNINEDVYDVHFFTVEFTGSHQDITVFIDFSTDNGSSFLTDDLAYSTSYGESDGTFNQSTSTDLYGIILTQSNDTNLGTGAYGYFYNLGNSGRHSYVNSHAIYERSGDSDVKRFQFGGGSTTADQTVDAFRFYPNIASPGITGNYALYGLEQS
tara:strand:+ start:667 stop:1251 length:585 start_codon:yes stop_codon:yes gene_type:complete